MRLFYSIGHQGHCRQSNRAAALALGLVLVFLSGCDLSNPLLSSPQQGAAFQGRVRGGQQPVSGASILLYAAGSTGTGAGAVNLLAPNIVTTDAFGFSTLPATTRAPPQPPRFTS